MQQRRSLQVSAKPLGCCQDNMNESALPSRPPYAMLTSCLHDPTPTPSLAPTSAAGVNATASRKPTWPRPFASPARPSPKSREATASSPSSKPTSFTASTACQPTTCPTSDRPQQQYERKTLDGQGARLYRPAHGSLLQTTATAVGRRRGRDTRGDGRRLHLVGQPHVGPGGPAASERPTLGGGTVRFLCRNCRSIFIGSYNPPYPAYCPACSPTCEAPPPPSTRKRSTKRVRPAKPSKKD